MGRQMFCIKCGREAVPGTVFCSECMSRGEPLASAPGVITFEICPSCGRMKRGSSWVKVEDTDALMRTEIRKSVVLAAGATISSIEIKGLNSGENSSNAEIALTLSTHGVSKKELLPVRVRVEGNTCPTCNRKSGHYFESTIQLRSRGETRKEVIERALSYATGVCSEYERTEKGFFVSGVKETRGGADIALSSSTVGAAVAKKIAQRFGADVVPTRKLYGRKNGKEIYRTTFLVRIAMFNPGDYVRYRGGFFRVQKALESITLSPLPSGRPVTVSSGESDALELIGGKELEDWVEVVSEDRDGAIVIDPRSMESETVRTAGGHPRGSRLRIVHLGSELYETAQR